MSKFHVDLYGWQKEAIRRAESAGVSVTFDPACKCPQVAKTGARRFAMTLPTLPENLTREDFLVHRSSFIHEMGHTARPEIFDIMERRKLRAGTPAWACLNALEDCAQERAMGKRWPGDRAALSDGVGVIISRQIAKLPGEGIPPEALEMAKRQMVLKGLMLGASLDWQPEREGLLEAWLAAAECKTPGAEQLFLDLGREGWIDQIRGITDCASTDEVAKALHKRLFPEDKQDESKSDGEGEGEPTDADGDGEDKPGKGYRYLVPWELILNSDHMGDGTAHPSMIDWTGKTTDGAVAWFPKSRVDMPRGGTAGILPQVPNALIQEVRRLLQARQRVRWTGEKLEGRLDRRNLARVAMPLVGDGTFNRSVFKNRDPAITLNAAVTILTDTSGSMAGPKYQAACAASVALYDLFAVSLRLPIEMIGFTTYTGREPRYFIHKTFGEKRLKRDVLYGRMRDAGPLQGNADGDAIMFACDRIAKRREVRKIIVVLSDGSPAEAVLGDPDSALKSAIKIARRTPGVEVYGIGIMDNNVKRYYSPTAPVVNTPDQITPALLECLRDILQRK